MLRNKTTSLPLLTINMMLIRRSLSDFSILLGSILVVFIGQASSGFAPTNNIQDDSEYSVLELNHHEQPSSSLRRRLVDEVEPFLGPLTCIRFNTFPVGLVLNGGEALCASNANGVYAQFGIRVTPGSPEPAYTEYAVILWVDGVERFISSVGIQTGSRDPPFIFLQHDGNLLFDDNRGFSNCVVFPGSHSNKNLLNLRVTAGNEAELYITDKSNKAVWRFETGSCYPDVPNRCHSEIRSNTRISWKEFLCSSDERFRYGLDDTGSVGLWRDNQLVYRPKGTISRGWARGDYFHFQNDGHLTVYREDQNTRVKTFKWTSDGCIDPTAKVLKMTSKGDVKEFNLAGDVVWTLMGSKAPLGTVTDARDSVPEVCHT
jgi:hypothetical protein